MKNFFENNFLIIILFLILIVPLVIKRNDYVVNYNNVIKVNNRHKTECLEGKYDINSENCQFIINQGDEHGDFFYMFFDIFCWAEPVVILSIIFVLIINTTYYNSKYLKYNILSSELQRKSYKFLKRKKLLNAYKIALVMPVVCIVAFCFCYSFYKSFNVVNPSSLIWSVNSMNKPILFMVLYVLNLLVHSILFINISLIIVRKIHNFFLSTIVAFLSVIAIELFLEIFMNLILFVYILKNTKGLMFNIINFFSFRDLYNIYTPLIVPTILLVISFGILYVIYRDREKLIIDCEKNDGDDK